MTEFYNPYNFIPFNVDECKGKIEPSKEALIQNDISHQQIYHKKLTGKINYTLKSLTSIALGNQHKVEGGLTYILPYFNNGNAAIAGNSIRGMTGSLAEIISQSPPRVLANQLMSVRQKMQAYDLAYGVVLPSPDPNNSQELSIQPLGLANIILEKGTKKKIPKKWSEIFVDQQNQPLPLKDILAIRLSDKKARQSKYTKNNMGEWVCSNLARVSLVEDTMFSNKTLGDIIENVPSKTDWLEPVMTGGRNRKKHTNDRLLRREDTHSEKVDAIVRTSDAGKGESIAFITQGALNKSPKLNIPNSTIALYRENFKTSTPSDNASSKLTDKQIDEQLLGQIIVFDIDTNNAIKEIKPSVVWRETLKNSVHDFLNQESIPYQGQRKLSPVEQMFGFITKDKTKKEIGSKKPLAAYASRLKFSDAVCNNQVEQYQNEANNFAEDYFVMPLMSSPKLPCPTMYFHNKNNTWQSKQWVNADQSNLNGRKVYLRHMEPNITLEKYNPASKVNYNNRSLIKLIPPNETFSGTIEFENLSTVELELLVASLQPTNTFIHQLGHAKAFGYGQMALEQATISLVDTEKAYQVKQLFQPNYEYSFCLKSEFNTWLTEQNNKTHVKNESLIHQHSLLLLGKLGSYNAEWGGWEITYPSAKNSKNETLGFQWFVHNEVGNKTTGRENNKRQQTLSRLELSGILPLKRNDL